MQFNKVQTEKYSSLVLHLPMLAYGAIDALVTLLAYRHNVEGMTQNIGLT